MRALRAHRPLNTELICLTEVQWRYRAKHGPVPDDRHAISHEEMQFDPIKRFPLAVQATPGKLVACDEGPIRDNERDIDMS